MMRVRIQPNGRSLASVMAELLHQHKDSPPLLPYNARLRLVAQPHDPQRGQQALQLAHIDQRYTELLAREDAPPCASSLNDALRL